ncbi:MAG: hypothetical protein K5908_03580 [Erysipelotrichaceae bacterium]|nr:hypothetical protein [Erysipelotrichaceae bacterium]
MGFRTDFYSLLLNEVKEFTFDIPSKSSLPFLAEELKKTKKFSSNSAVALLKELDERYAKKQIDERTYFISLLKVALDKKIRIQENVYKQILLCRDLFPYLSQDSREELHSDLTGQREYRLFYKRTEKIFHSLDEGKKSPIGQSDDLIRLSGMFMAEALVAQAKMWLYDAGYSVNGTETLHQRKIDPSIRMVDDFFQREKTAYFLQGYDHTYSADINKEDIEDTKELFRLMDKDPDYSCAAIPVLIDPSSGTSLYIYGTESDERAHPVYMENRMLARRAASGHHCYYTIFEYCGSHRDTDRFRFPDAPPGRLTYQQHVTHQTGGNKSVGYIELEDALYDYKQLIANGDLSLYGDYMPEPQGCPKRFRKYFSNEEEEDDLFMENSAEIASYKREEEKQKKEIGIDLSHLHF